MKRFLQRIIEYFKNKRHNPQKKQPIVHEKVPREHEKMQKKEHGKYPGRIWPKDQEHHKGPKF